MEQTVKNESALSKAETGITNNSTSTIFEEPNTGITKPPMLDPNAMFMHVVNNTENNKKEIDNIKAEQEKMKEFYRSSASLSKTVKIVIIILMIVPIIQVLVCGVIVYSLGIQDKLPNYLSYFLGGISVLSIIEFFVGAVKLYANEKSLEALKMRIDKIEEKISNKL